MKNLLYKNVYQEIFYHQDIKMIELVSFPESSEYSDAAFKRDVKHFCQCLSEKEVELYQNDMTHFKYIIVPEMQKWIVKTVYPYLIQAGVKKIALIVSEDIFSRVSTEQTVRKVDKEKPPFTRKYFKSKDVAMDWLLERNKQRSKK